MLRITICEIGNLHRPRPGVESWNGGCYDELNRRSILSGSKKSLIFASFLRWNRFFDPASSHCLLSVSLCTFKKQSGEEVSLSCEYGHLKYFYRNQNRN